MTASPTLEWIPRGWVGTERTLQRMTELAVAGARSWPIIQVATIIVQNEPPRDARAELSALLSFVKSFVRYQRDPVGSNGEGVELVQAPLRTLQRKSGDCDDLSILLCALAMALGYQCEFVVIKADRATPDEFSHVYAAAQVGLEWLALDATVSESVLGWEAPVQWGRKEWRI